ncbi:hypothetical protein HZC08_00105 [Candidatus Micrarchaeota archaeon]|nr:hypothetical protein [Candidatus Micrarchaeota archaeon]
MQQRFETQTPEGKNTIPSEVLKTNATSIIDKAIEPLVKPIEETPKEVKSLGTGKNAIKEDEIRS